MYVYICVYERHHKVKLLWHKEQEQQQQMMILSQTLSINYNALPSSH